MSEPAAAGAPIDHAAYRDSLACIEIGGRKQAYRRIGPRHAPPLVLLHGLMDNSAGFAPLIAALEAEGAPGHDIIAPDWRGHGDSQPTPGEYWFPNYLADLEALLGQLDIKQPAVLIGHSMGGQVASLYAGTRPDRVAGLVTLDSLNVPDNDPAEAPDRYRDWLDSVARRGESQARCYPSRAAFADRLAQRYPELDDARRLFLAGIWLRAQQGGGWRLAADPAHRRRMPYGFRAAEAEALWRRVSAPVLCIDGAASPAAGFIDAATRRARRACFADVAHAEIAGCGHMLHVQDASAVAERIVRFLRRLSAST